MRKGLLGLIAVGLLCWAGYASATTVNLNNGLVNVSITNGVITDMSLVGGSDELTAFTFVMYSPSTGAVVLSGADVSYNFDSMGVTLPGGFKADRHVFSKAIKDSVTGVKVATMYGKFVLVDDNDPLDGRDERYIDIRYTLTRKGTNTLSNIGVYLVMEGDGALNESDESAPNSSWTMVNDLPNIWAASDPWPVTKKVLSVGQTGFIARVGIDDFMGDTAANVWTKVLAGEALPGHPSNPGYVMNQPGAGVPGAVAMRIPVSPGMISLPPSFHLDARVEVVPEPCTMGLMLAGLAGLGAVRRRNRKS